TPYCWYGISLAFDPAVSFHYHVFPFPKGGLLKEPLSATRTQGEVPPLEGAQAEEFEEPMKKVFSMLMYSSCTGQWEDQEFTPGLCAPRHLYDMVGRTPESYRGLFHSSNYWRGSVYMHCQNSVLVILRPSKRTYDMVQLPGEPCGPKSWWSLPKNSVLASYERGVHYVATKNSQLRVWMLSELTDGQLGWTLSHDASVNLHVHMIRTLKLQPKVTWRIVGSSGGPVSLTDNDAQEDWATPYYSEHSWNSDEDNFIDMVGGADHHELVERGSYCSIMGFHPHKNVLILVLSGAVVVYYLDTSRMQYLGDAEELDKDHTQQACCVENSFIYQPCYNDMLPTGKLSMPPQNDIRSNCT
uniref:F-box associated domain-containing protein n=2 Tax=Aegilops tauschii TaxID=37682 RepID=A0A453GRI6_AEGTS